MTAIKTTNPRQGIFRSSPVRTNSSDSRHHHGGHLRKAWRVVRKPMETSVVRGNFSRCPALGARFIQATNALCESDIPDNRIYKALEAFFRSEIAPDITESFQGDRAQCVSRRLDQVLGILGDFHPTSYVDIGCGYGDITRGLQDSWGLPKSKVTGLEVCIPPGVDPQFKLLKFDGKHLPIPNESTDLVSLFVVLHHTEDPLQTLKEAYRILKPGGHLVVRELDAPNKKTQLFNSVMDHMFYEVYTPCPDVPIPDNYLGVEDWEQLFWQAGFLIDKITFPEPTNPYQPFMANLRKS